MLHCAIYSLDEKRIQQTRCSKQSDGSSSKTPPTLGQNIAPDVNKKYIASNWENRLYSCIWCNLLHTIWCFKFQAIYFPNSVHHNTWLIQYFFSSRITVQYIDAILLPVVAGFFNSKLLEKCLVVRDLILKFVVKWQHAGSSSITIVKHHLPLRQ